MINNSTSHSGVLKEGQPQGSFFHKIMFIMYINNVQDKSDVSTLVSAYTENLKIARNDRNRDQVTQELQKNVDRITNWSMEAKLTLNTSKYQMAFFNPNSTESRWQPNIAIPGAKLSCKPNPIYLGITNILLVNMSTNFANPC